MSEKIEEEKFYTPREVAEFGVSEILSSRAKVIFLCDEKNTDIPLHNIRRGSRILIKGQWILDFISKNNL